MAVPSGTRTTYSAVGIREDLSNVIYNISPTDTPFLNGAGRASASGTFFEWETDTLATAADNWQLEGTDLTSATVVEPRRVGNYMQISAKAIQSSGTSMAVDFAGRKSTQAYRMAKAAKEIKRDMEKMLTQNTAAVVGTNTSAGTAGQPTGDTRKTGSLGAWVGGKSPFPVGNTSHGGGSPAGAACDGDGNDATVDAATKRAVSLLLIRAIIQKLFVAGSDADTIMVGPFNKEAISQLASSSQISPLRTAANKESQAHVVEAWDIYVSDFGNFKVIPNRFQRERDGWFLDFDFWGVSYLRPFQTLDIARTGDSKKQELIVEYGLLSKNQYASGCMYDLNTS
jgi:hypothetical protein